MSVAVFERMRELESGKRGDANVGPREVGRLAAPALRKFGVARAWVYGSFALGRANAHSDVDLIVEMPPGVVLGRAFFDLRRELKETFGREVDLHLPPNDAARAEYVRVLERTKVLVFDDASRRSNQAALAASRHEEQHEQEGPLR